MRKLAIAITGAVLFAGGLDISPTVAGEKTAAPTAPSIDPAALKAGGQMGAYLRSLQGFEVNASAILEEVVDEAGKKSTSLVNTTYRVRRPDAFLIDMTTPTKARRFVYDGRAFTVFAPKVGYFATVSAPATIDETVKLIYQDYGVILPLADLFYWGTDAQPTDMVTSAKRLGQDKIGGVDTDHYAFAGPGMSWEVWIQQGEAPLPRRMRIITVDDPARPTYTADLTWKTGVSFAPDTFTFKPATGAKPIAMARVGQ